MEMKLEGLCCTSIYKTTIYFISRSLKGKKWVNKYNLFMMLSVKEF